MSQPILDNLFSEVCGKYLEEQGGFDTRGELGIFSTAAVVWLGVQQRLKGGSLQESLGAFVEKIKTQESMLLVRRPGKKFRDGEISLATGGLSRARDRLPESLVQELYETATKNIEKKLTTIRFGRPVYIMDGQVITIARTDSNLTTFSSTGNGEGELHYPRIRVVTAHAIATGVATKIAIGSWRQSEIALGREVLEQLPKGSLLVMDRGFHRPTFLNWCKELNIDVLVRLKDPAGNKLMGGCDESEGEARVNWESKQEDKTKIVLQGRVIKYTSKANGFRSNLFHFFTTANELTVREISELYRQRVQVEVCIRHLKQTLKLFFIGAKKGSNVKKEILIAYLTFNLLRAVMEDTANATGIDVERMSFTATITLCSAYASSFAKASTAKEQQALTEQFRKHMLQTKLPLRKKERSYPREVKLTRRKYNNAAIVKSVKQNEGK